MALGCLLALVLRFLAAGHYVGLEEEPAHAHMLQLLELDSQGWGLVLLLLVAVPLRAKLVSRWRPWAKRAVSVLTNLCGMAAAWTLLLGFRWQYVHTWQHKFHSIVPAKLMLALCISLGAVGVILALNIATKILDDEHDPSPSTLRSVMMASGLLVGLSWEETFQTAIELLAESPGVDHLVIKVCLSCALFLIVFPSWQWYILPRTESRLTRFLEQDYSEDEDDVELMKVIQESGSSGTESDS
eukprot:SRR837773.14128.p1 GENE.SRR837773.14128~~SRR837773.14128.p1  ORF type:complete len:255 (-),score=104.65 SRR837773.14128:75-803(-)